jgi:hypothetical protein
MKIFALACLLLASYAGASKTCLKQLDVVLVVEDSNLLADPNSESSLINFLAAIVNHLNLGANDAHVAYQQYSDQSRTIFDLNTYLETTDAKSAILRTPFTHPASVNAPTVAPALNYTWSTVLTVTNGERSCYPTVVILVSYSSYTDPNGRAMPNSLQSADLSAARQLRNSGALLIAVGVGPNRSPEHLLELVGSDPSNYFDYNDFSDLDQAAAGNIADKACNYVPTNAFYPGELETIYADVVFVVDVSQKFDATLQDAVTNFTANFLKPFTYGKNGVQAALVTYHKTADVAVSLNGASNYDAFIKQAQAVLDGAPYGTERYIYNALDTVQNHVLVATAGYRPNAAHQVYVFSADCFTGQDPVQTAQAIRSTSNTEIFVVSLGQQIGFWKEYLDVAGDAPHLLDVQANPEVVLPNYLTKQAWRSLLAANPGQPTTVAPPPATSGATTSPTAPPQTTT